MKAVLIAGCLSSALLPGGVVLSSGVKGVALTLSPTPTATSIPPTATPVAVRSTILNDASSGAVLNLVGGAALVRPGALANQFPSCPGGKFLVDSLNDESREATTARLAALQATGSLPELFEVSAGFRQTYTFPNPIQCVAVISIEHRTPYAADQARFGYSDFAVDGNANYFSIGLTSPGIYTVAVYFANGAPAVGYKFLADVSDRECGLGGCRTSPEDRHLDPNPGECLNRTIFGTYSQTSVQPFFTGTDRTVLVSNDGSPLTKKVMANLPYDVGATWWDDTPGAVRTIRTAYEQNGKHPIKLILDGHGKASKWILPEGVIGPGPASTGIKLSDDQAKFFNDMYPTGARGMIESVTFSACCTGAGFIDPTTGLPRGNHLLVKLAEGLGANSVTGWDQIMIYIPPIFWRKAYNAVQTPDFGKSNGYTYLNPNPVHLTDDVPESTCVAHRLSSDGVKRLDRGQAICTPSLYRRVILTAAGEIVLWETIQNGREGIPIWKAPATQPAQYLEMQKDCNLVAYDAAGKDVWSTATVEPSKIPLPCFALIQDDSNFVVYKDQPKQVPPVQTKWSSKYGKP